jgi:hypothetical protein
MIENVILGWHGEERKEIPDEHVPTLYSSHESIAYFPSGCNATMQ